jgi:hypothetical protein
MAERLAEQAIRIANKLDIPVYVAVQMVTTHLTKDEYSAVLQYIVSTH